MEYIFFIFSGFSSLIRFFWHTRVHSFASLSRDRESSEQRYDESVECEWKKVFNFSINEFVREFLRFATVSSLKNVSLNIPNFSAFLCWSWMLLALIMLTNIVVHYGKLDFLFVHLSLKLKWNSIMKSWKTFFRCQCAPFIREIWLQSSSKQSRSFHHA